jgi:CubicO group peptidase (beta-lactamase class C family)
MQKLKLLFLAITACLIFDSCSSQSNAEEEMTKVDKISDYLKTIEHQGFHGGVLVDIGGEKVLSEGYGLSDVDKNIRNTNETIFDIGSITKQFTAAGILKLEMQGKLSVDDLMSKYIEQVSEDKKDITLHHLLTHSAGFPGGIGDDYEDITTEDFITLAMSKPLSFSVGSDYDYSNVGYTLLAIIIEKVSGETYETYLNNNLFQPAGMTTTGYLIPKWNGQLIATGYKNDIRWGKPNEKWTSGNISWHLKGNGGILSTVEDMYKWHQGLLTDDILSAEAKEKFYKPHVREGEGANSFYAYGWAIFPTPRETELVAHNGGNGIFFADFLRYFEEKVTIIVLCNRSTRYAERVATEIGGIILKEGYRPNYPEGSGIELDEEEVNTLANAFMGALKQSDKAQWESFIRNNCTEEFIGFASMKQHLEFFGEFHEAFGTIEPSTVDVSGNAVQITFEKEDGFVLVTLELSQLPSGEVKVGGIMVD